MVTLINNLGTTVESSWVSTFVDVVGYYYPPNNSRTNEYNKAINCPKS